jgi:hypothetical protein
MQNQFEIGQVYILKITWGTGFGMYSDPTRQVYSGNKNGFHSFYNEQIAQVTTHISQDSIEKWYSLVKATDTPVQHQDSLAKGQ